MNPPRMEEARRDPEGDDLGIDYAGGAAAEEQVGLQYDEAGVLVAGTFAFSTGREQIEEESGDEDEGSSEDDSSEEEGDAPIREEESGVPLIEDINDDLSDVESMESEVVSGSPAVVEEVASSELPYLFDAPNDYNELVSLLDQKSNQDCDTILTRLRALYNPKLAHENKAKLEVFIF
jgi:hypothetical protein